MILAAPITAFCTFVAGNPGISIADLLDILRVTKQSLARVLRDLIDGDYVEQRIGANDRRKRLLTFNRRKVSPLHGKLIAPQEKRFNEVLTALWARRFLNNGKRQCDLSSIAKTAKMLTS